MPIVHLFVSCAHVNLCHFFSSSWCQGLAATSAWGSSWTFLFVFLNKTFLIPSIVHAPDRSKVVVLVLFLFCVALWFILRDASCFKVFPCSLYSCFIIPFSIVITSLGAEELVCVLLVHLFVCFVCVSFCHFSLPLVVWGWLWFVIVALPGLFY